MWQILKKCKLAQNSLQRNSCNNLLNGYWNSRNAYLDMNDFATLWKTMNLHITLFVSSFLSIATFHILDLNISSKVKVSDDHSNQGWINSTIVNNWQQSLNVGSVSLGSCLMIMLVGLVLYLRLENQMSHSEAQLFKLTKEISSIKDAKKSVL